MRRNAGPDERGKICPTTGIRSRDRPARNELLYRLRYPGLLYGCKYAKQRDHLEEKFTLVLLRTE